MRFQGAPHLIHRHEDGTEEWMAFFTDPAGNTLALMSQVRSAPRRGGTALTSGWRSSYRVVMSSQPATPPLTLRAEGLSATPRTRLGRHRERGATDRAALHEVLADALICHVGFVADGSPVVLPTGYGVVGENLYLHGSVAARPLVSPIGRPICVTVTLLDGIVLARSAFHHSMNYRSAVVFGVPRLVTDPAEKLLALECVTEHLAPGQWTATRQPTRKELAATSVLALSLDEASVKVRSGPPIDEPEDVAAGGWAGVLPTLSGFAEPVTAPDVPAGCSVPGHVRDRVGQTAATSGG